MKHIAIINYGDKSVEGISNILQDLDLKYTVLLPYEVPNFMITHVILSGGPKHVYEDDHYPLPLWILENDIPVLGICYGMHIITQTLGGRVSRMTDLEKGLIKIIEYRNNQLSISEKWMNRYDKIDKIPPYFMITGVTIKGDISAFTDNIKWWAIQYHPESSKSIDIDIFKFFLTK